MDSSNRRRLYRNQYLTMSIHESVENEESIFYCGESEIEAFRAYKKLKGRKRKIILADIIKVYILNTYFIENVDIINVIKDENR